MEREIHHPPIMPEAVGTKHHGPGSMAMSHRKKKSGQEVSGVLMDKPAGARKTLYLVCNAHLDPVWLWTWEEGVAAALSTFRTAADFCEHFETFVFNHNESLLYEWVERYDPNLFDRIRELVEKGRWHIMGGWYLQPDCNMPCGESFVRQILVGIRYFEQKFGVRPITAVNFDSFGHSRGLVQILKKSGFDSYIFCRPGSQDLVLPGDDFLWTGYDGSEVVAHHARYHYNSEKGKAIGRIRAWFAENGHRESGILLWGIGNHGGGPSREDLSDIEDLKRTETRWQIVHGTPKDYFEVLSDRVSELPRHEADLNPWAVGCYTSMAAVKQAHRSLEHDVFLTEKMIAHAWLEGCSEYPSEILREAVKDLLFCQFHDILPGSAVSEVESDALRRMHHGSESLARLRHLTFYRLLQGLPAAEAETFPIFVYNPHPFSVKETLICELQPLEPNRSVERYLLPELTDPDGRSCPCQEEKESSNINEDFRKRLVFEADLKPAAMHRFTCRLKEIGTESRPHITTPADARWKLGSSECEMIFNRKTGLPEAYRVGGIDFLTEESFLPMVFNDSPDPWGMQVRAFRNLEGRFELMSRREAARFAGVDAPELDAVRIIEDGPIRTVVESLFGYDQSAICLRFFIPKRGSEITVESRVLWFQKDRFLKLSLPLSFNPSFCLGEVVFGTERFEPAETERVAQTWVAAMNEKDGLALTVINDRTYGFDFFESALRLSLLRSPAYTGHPTDNPPIVPQDRFEPRIDQGEHVFRYWIEGGRAKDLLPSLPRRALVKNERLQVHTAYPSGEGKSLNPGIRLSDASILLTAVKRSEQGGWLVLRLFEPTGNGGETIVNIPSLDLEHPVKLDPFELKTLAVHTETLEIEEIDPIETGLSEKRGIKSRKSRGKR